MLDFLYGALLVAGVGTPAIVAQFGPPPVVGLALIGIGLVQLIGLAWRIPAVVLSTVFLTGWLWASLAVTSIVRVSATGGIASFAIFTLMSAWVFARIVIALCAGRSFDG